MKKQLAIIGIVAILVTVGLSGCNQVSNSLNPESRRFIGTWEPESSAMMFIGGFIFESDGTLFAFGQKAGTWAVKNNRLELYMTGPGGSGTVVYNYVFSDNDTTLTLTPVGFTYGTIYHKKI